MNKKLKQQLVGLIDPVFNKKGKFNGNELKYVMQYLNSECPDNEENPWTARLEKAFSEKFGVKYAIAHNSGTSTLHSCLHAASVGAGDEVIVPVQTVICLTFAVIQQNAIPVYVDLDPYTFNMNPKDIEKRLTAKTKATIAVHMHGLPSDMDKIMQIAQKYNLIVIEDCAQSFLTNYKGRLTGTIGHMASLSFETKKHMTTDQGGMVITDDPVYAERVRKHAGLGYKTLGPKQGMTSLMPHQFQNPHYKRHDSFGYNYRMPEICAALGLAQLERLDKHVERRRYIASLYQKALKGCEWIIPQKTPEGYTNSYWTFTVKYYGEEKFGVSWKQFYDLFNSNGGDGFYGALSLQHQETVMIEKLFYGTYIPAKSDLYKDKFNYNNNSWPVAESIQPIMMQFKTGYRDMDKAKRVADALRKTIKHIEGN